MGELVGDASVKYGDWKGTVAADDPDDWDGLYEIAGISHDDWEIVGIELGGSYTSGGAWVYAIPFDTIGEFGDWRRFAKEAGGALPCKRFRIHPEDDEIAAKLLTAMKRWNVVVKMRHALVDQGIDLEYEPEETVVIGDE